MRTLQNLTALVINADDGRGQAVAERYAALNANIILHCELDRPGIGQLISTIRAMDSNVTRLQARAENDKDLALLLEKLKHEFRKPDIIAINDKARVFDLNMISNIAMQMARDGRLIYIVQIGGQTDLNTIAGWIEKMGQENASREISVNAVFIPSAELTLFSRPTEDADVADAAEFFASDLANLISGQYLLLNATSNIHLT